VNIHVVWVIRCPRPSQTYVGVEPSGDAFNAIELHPGTNRPYNPMVNSGAIAVTALLHAEYGAKTFDRVLDVCSELAARFGLHAFDCLNAGSSFLEVVL
jgi:glutaminase